jgi:hypothetical protein
MNEAKEAGEEPLAAAAAAADWAALEAKWAKSNLSFSEELMGASMLPLDVSEGLSSLLAGLCGGELCLDTAEKADNLLSLDFGKLWWWWWAAAKRLL